MTRRTASLTAAVALMTPVVLGLSVGTAHAEGSFASPTPNGGSSLSSTTFQVKANTTKKGTSVTLSGPAGFTTISKSSSTAVTASANQVVDLGSVDASKYPNGTWTAKVSSGESRTFYSNFAPATPSGFSADSSGEHDVFLSWSKGSESDLIGYTLYDGDGHVLQSNITAASACSGSSCHYSLYYDNPTPGTYDYSYRLSALRSGGCGSSSCAPVESSKTSSKSATLVTPKPAPTPTPTPSTNPGGSTGGGSTDGTTGGSTGGSSGGTTGGSSSGSGSGSGGGAVTTGGKPSTSPAALPTLDPVAVQKRAFALNFGNFSASLGIPKLPPLPATDPQLPTSEALPEGTFKPSLPYANATETTKTTSFFRNPVGTFTEIDPHKLWPMIASSLILIMTAAHLRRWVGAHVED